MPAVSKSQDLVECAANERLPLDTTADTSHMAVVAHFYVLRLVALRHRRMPRRMLCWQPLHHICRSP